MVYAYVLSGSLHIRQSGKQMGNPRWATIDRGFVMEWKIVPSHPLQKRHQSVMGCWKFQKA